MHAAVGASILDRWERSGAPSLFVVGTGKNVGKTVTMRAVYRALLERGVQPALASIGRDGEAIDAGDAVAKPRLWLEPGTVLATARAALPSSPASELLDLPEIATAVGPLILARVRQGTYYELIGPPTASGLRYVVNRLRDFAPRVLVDGAIDRLAAVAGGEDAIVVACGAAAAATPEEVADDVRALTLRLQTPRYEPQEERIEIDGALTPARVAELLRARESRAVVVRDPTQIALTGRAAIAAFERLRIRCERPLCVIAVTVNSAGRDRWFEPRALAQAVARASGLPTYDVYTAEIAA
jgi:uncharacterized NAD-dependent epimerase/dehydratase family protein